MAERPASAWWALALGVMALAAGLLAALLDRSALGIVSGAAGLLAGVVAVGARTTSNGSPGRRQPFGEDTDSLRARIDELEGRADAAEGADPRSPPVAGSRGVTDAADGLTDPESGLYSEAYFDVALGWRLASARRHLRPVAVAIIDLVVGLPVEDRGPPAPEHVAEAIERTLRDADLACRLDDGRYAFIMEDTPETGAVWTVERLRRMLVGRFGSHTTWAGVACYPVHALDADDLLAQATAALASAHDWPQDRIEVALPLAD